ncbi:glycoside hydrolase family 97 catalytic domain-containing protein [Pontiella sp.]|uniref:glycoside hydrolase family 97 protein n=1 Tax=Pontiella sp. TaxID=2837462 RepID=UPI00356AD0CA
MKNHLLTMLAFVLPVANLFAAPAAVQSPNGQVAVSFEVKDGALRYAISKGGKSVVDSSALEIFAGAKMAVVDGAVRQNDTSWSPTYGQFSTVRDLHNELTLSLTAGGTPVTLLCRVFDSGVGIRFVMSKESNGKKTNFVCGYGLVDAAGCYHPKGESGVAGPLRLNQLKKISIPLVVERTDGLALALLESDLYSADGFEEMGLRFDEATQSVVSSSSAVSGGEGTFTPWRVILIGDSVGDLMVNTVALNLAAPCKLDDAGWVKPGKGLWDWRIHGYDNGEFVYDINTRSYLHLIDFCAEQGIELLTVDDHWFTKAGGGTMEVSPEVDIKQVMAYAKKKGVQIMLYYDRKKGDFGDETLFDHYAGLGASGMKYGFMGSKTSFTRNAIDKAAEKKMLINFHDGPVPMTGVERTMPNLITREYCHAQQDSRRAFTPETFIKMAMVNGLVGPLDMANGNFGIKSINAGERKKGPKKQNSYVSTVVSEVARTLVIYTGLITLPDAPEEYLKKADLFEFLRQMPATWDESRVLQSKIGSQLSIARRTGDVWFVGSVGDQTARTVDLRLDFLEAGRAYEATLYQDAPDAHGVKNPEAYEIKTATVKRGDVIRAKLAVGGGHAMILRPKP